MGFFPLVQETVAHFLNCWDECSPREHPQWQQGFKYHDVSRERCLLGWSQTTSGSASPRLNQLTLPACSVIPDSSPPRTVAHQAPLSMHFPRQEYWRGLPFPSPGDLPNTGIEPMSPALACGSLPLSHGYIVKSKFSMVLPLWYPIFFQKMMIISNIL